MAELPVLPLKTDALLADNPHMSAEEFGAYVRILCVMWRHGARLTYERSEFARIAGVTPRRWDKIREVVMRPMTVVDNVVTQKRLSATWLDVQELRQKRAQAAASRWTSKRGPNGHAYA